MPTPHPAHLLAAAINGIKASKKPVEAKVAA
jgi:hypothetical protein